MKPQEGVLGAFVVGAQALFADIKTRKYLLGIKSLRKLQSAAKPWAQAFL